MKKKINISKYLEQKQLEESTLDLDVQGGELNPTTIILKNEEQDSSSLGQNRQLKMVGKIYHGNRIFLGQLNIINEENYDTPKKSYSQETQIIPYFIKEYINGQTSQVTENVQKMMKILLKMKKIN